MDDKKLWCCFVSDSGKHCHNEPAWELHPVGDTNYTPHDDYTHACDEHLASLLYSGGAYVAGLVLDD